MNLSNIWCRSKASAYGPYTCSLYSHLIVPTYSRPVTWVSARDSKLSTNSKTCRTTRKWRGSPSPGGHMLPSHRGTFGGWRTVPVRSLVRRRAGRSSSPHPHRVPHVGGGNSSFTDDYRGRFR